MHFVDIPFSKKKEAKRLGVEFNYEDNNRGWYIPETISEENKQLILELNQIDNNPILQNSKEENVSIKGFNENVVKSPDTNSINENIIWEQILQTDDNLEIILNIKKYSMPQNQDLRIKILKAMDRIRKMPNGYPVTYEDLTIYCESFKQRYPYEKILELLQNIRLDIPYIEAIQNASFMNDEEKALALFVVPI